MERECTYLFCMPKMHQLLAQLLMLTNCHHHQQSLCTKTLHQVKSFFLWTIPFYQKSFLTISQLRGILLLGSPTISYNLYYNLSARIQLPCRKNMAQFSLNSNSCLCNNCTSGPPLCQCSLYLPGLTQNSLIGYLKIGFLSQAVPFFGGGGYSVIIIEVLKGHSKKGFP